MSRYQDKRRASPLVSIEYEFFQDCKEEKATNVVPLKGKSIVGAQRNRSQSPKKEITFFLVQEVKFWITIHLEEK